MTDSYEYNPLPFDAKAIRAKAKELAKQKSKKLGDFSQEEAKKIFLDLDVHKIELEMQNEELRRAQAELYETRNRYFELYNLAPVCYCTLNQKGLITESNLTTSKMLGLTRAKLHLKLMSDFIFRDDQDIYYLNQKQTLKSCDPKSCELRMVKNDGTLCWVLMSSVLNTNEYTGTTISLTMSDITDKKKILHELEEERKLMLLQSRYAAMGEMISMIAHQWRQPLNVVGLAVANIQTMKALGIEDEKKVEDNIALVAQNITFMSETIDDFRNYFKPNAPKERVKMQDVLQSALSVIGSVLRSENIALHIQDTTTTTLMIHKNSLVQVLLNILGNAKDALLANKIKPAAITIMIYETDKTFMIKICDNAGGIPENLLNKIGEPYFSSKKLNGTGLGLYMSKTIIEKHFEGTFSWHNELTGACFEIGLKKEV